MNKLNVERITTGLFGGFLLYFVDWQAHAAIAVWIAMILLVRSFRLTDRWYGAIPVLILTYLVRILSVIGGWDMPVYIALGSCLLVLLPLWTALYLDRWYARTGKPWGALVMFPLVYTAGDFLLGLSPIGSVFSIGATQFNAIGIAQLVSVTGLWGITFLINFTATVGNLVWEKNFNLKNAAIPVFLIVSLFVIILSYGYAKIHLSRPNEGTVRIAGITEPHPRNYWTITDQGTPPSSQPIYGFEMNQIRNRLFEKSARVADYGAQIIVWSEGNAVMYEDELDDFLVSAREFARVNDVYFAPTPLVLRYNQMKNDNLVYLIDPEGKILFRYEKSISWYPTDSDGVIPSAVTPWGNVAAVICFDLDFPAFIRQAYKNGVDILLVPGYDTERISPYHTQIGSLRGVEYGFSVFRQANESTSIATDYNGRVLASQDFFNTEDQIMIADIPVEGIRTIYGETGDWFVVLVWVALGFIMVYTIRDRRRQSKS